MRILTVNAGSSSLKLRLLGPGDGLAGSTELRVGDAGIDAGELAAALHALGPADAVGHRIVHGGTDFTAPVRIGPDVVARLERLTDLAPLHQPAALRALAAVTAVRGDLPAVACFDTAFHAGMPAAAATYAIPDRWRRLGVRRYGFHGLSHAYAARRGAELLGRPATGLRIVTCHLGAGASLAAVLDGRSVDTTMGFTPLDGLVMATRPGSVDPGLVPWLARHAGLLPARAEHDLEHASGLLALAGTADMAQVVERAAGGDGAAQLGLDVYLHRLAGGVAAMAASIRGLDALVFTGGVGERSPVVRARTAEALGFLGVAVDAGANAADGGDRDLSAAGAAVRTLVVAAREDIEIARGVRAVLGA
jgi:acetate kinase